ncbi:MAG: hypothetical protein ACF8R7_01420 [Phycisphaerales bacterium JB039]
MKKSASMVLACAWMIGCTTAHADEIAITSGVGTPGGSWTLSALLNTGNVGGPGVDLIGFRVIAGDPFEDIPALDPDAGSGWAQVYTNGGPTPDIAAIATTTAPGAAFSIDVNFSGTMSDPLSFEIAGFDGDSLLEIESYDWDGTGLFFRGSASRVGWAPTRSDFTVIPLPPAAWAGLAGLGLVAGVRRLRRPN